VILRGVVKVESFVMLLDVVREMISAAKITLVVQLDQFVVKVEDVVSMANTVLLPRMEMVDVVQTGQFVLGM